MEKIKIMVDTPSDIEYKDAQKRNIELLPVTITYQGKSYREEYDISKEDFFTILNECEELPSTAQVTPPQFLAAFEKAWKEGYTHIILTTINGAGSGTFNSARLAVSLFEEAHGKDAILFEIIDSHTYTLCYGRPVMQAAELVQQGHSFSEVVAFLKERLNHAHCYAYISTLKFARKSGRISMTAAIVGEALGLKPIMSVGNNTVDIYNKCRGEKSAIAKLIDNVKNEVPDPENQEIVLVYGDVPEPVLERFRKEVAEKLNPASIFEGRLGCAICNNAGPQTVGIIFSGADYGFYA